MSYICFVFLKTVHNMYVITADQLYNVYELFISIVHNILFTLCDSVHGLIVDQIRTNLHLNGQFLGEHRLGLSPPLS